MANITERRKKDGSSTWQIMIRLKGQPPIIKSFPTEDEAKQFVGIAEPKIIKAHAKASTLKFQEPGTLATIDDLLALPVKTIVQQYIDSGTAKELHIRNSASLLNNIDDKSSVGDLRRIWFKAYIARMRGKKTYRGTIFSYGSIQAQMQVLSIALAWKSEQLDVPRPQFAFSTRMFPKGWAGSRDRRLELHEQMAVVMHLRKSKNPRARAYRLMFLLALETGARLQELVRAEWSEVSIERRLWMIPSAHTKCRKTRAVPLSLKAIRVFKALLLLADNAKTRVFHNLGTPSTTCISFRNIFARSGLVDFKFHDLRHEAISRMVLYKRKLSVYEIMTIVGHGSLQMLNRYANLRGGELAHKMD